MALDPAALAPADLRTASLGPAELRAGSDPAPADAETLADLVADGTLVGATLPHGPRVVVIPDQAVRAVEGLSAYGD